jgi:hypothetical protein
MKPAARLAFAFGIAASLAVAVSGIVMYASHPGSGYWLIGQDELQHRAFADILLEQGSGNIFTNALEGEALTGDATWGTGFVIGLCKYAFGSDLSFIIVKWVLHVLATGLLYGLLKKYRGERVAGYVAFFFLIYPPLLVYQGAFLKDDMVAALVVIAAATLDRRWTLPLAAPLLLLLIIVRANAVVFPILLLGYLRRSRLRNVLIVAAVPTLAALYVLAAGAYFERMQGVLHLPVGTLAFYVAKYLIGPVPTNILDYETEDVLILPWYTLTFLAIFAGFLLPGFYASVRRNWVWIGLLLAACLAPYLSYVTEADVIGPRQFATVGWFFFLLFYERVLDRYGLTFGVGTPGEARWSAAT